MFRTSIFASGFLAIALGTIAAGTVAAPASAFSSRVFSAHMEQPMAHFHAVNSPGRTMFRPPSKKRA